MKNLILSLLVFVSLSVNGQTINEVYMTDNVQGYYYDSNHVYQYVDETPEYVGFGFGESTFTGSINAPNYPKNFIFDKTYSVGTIEIVTSESDTINLELMDNNQVVGSIKIVQPTEQFSSGEVTFTLNLVMNGLEYTYKGKLDHSMRYE